MENYATSVENLLPKDQGVIEELKFGDVLRGVGKFR